MSNINTNIQWTDRTWNPVTGCDRISLGCQHCYAEQITKRFSKAFPNGFDLTLHPERLKEPISWKKPAKIFVNSMSDLFHEDVPFEFINRVMLTISKTPRHIYQVLTKRPERMLQYFEIPKKKIFDGFLNFEDSLGTKHTFLDVSLLSNLWLGVSVEHQNYIKRIDYLRQIPAKVRFLSCEPLLGNLELDLTGIHWVIVGGESGQNYRPMQLEWAENIRSQCKNAGVPFFFKQVGGRTPKAGGNLLNGKEYLNFPVVG